MPINRDLNVAPYYDDFDISKKYYRVLFKPGYALQARELTQLQTTLQNQIEQFGDNIYKEGSIIKGCTFTELKNLSYVKVADGITPTLYVDKIGIADDNTIIEYYYELESATSGLKAYIVSASNGFQSKAPDLNTFYINYLNTVSTTQQKTFGAGETLYVKEYRIIKTTVTDPETLEETVTETLEGGDIVKTITVATFSNPIGYSYGLTVSEGIIFQKGHFLYADEQTIILVKYMPTNVQNDDFAQPHGISVGFVVTEEIITSQQDTSLLDNANGSENENAPGADRLKLSPVLVSISTATAVGDASFFTLRRYENGAATQIRDVSQFNSISEEMARRTYEESGDYIVRPFNFDSVRKNDKVQIKVGPGVVYAKGYRVQNNARIFLPVDDVTTTKIQPNQPLSISYGGYVRILDAASATGIVDIGTYQTVRLLDVSENYIGTAIVKDLTSSIARINSNDLNLEDNGRLYIFGIRMKDNATEFASVKYVKLGTGATGKIEIEPILRGVQNSRLVFEIGQNYLKGISDIQLYIRKKATISLDAGSSQAIIIPAAGEVFTSTSLDRIIAVSMNNTRLTVTNRALVSNNLTFEVPDQAGGTITVYYTVAISPTMAKAKQKINAFVKMTYQSSKTKFTLGLPDCYDLLQVKDAATGKLYTNSFRLVSNQKDDYYDHSYIEYIQGRPTPPENALITVKFAVFKPDSAGPYNFFTVNSYSSVKPSDIPYFRGKSGTYNLRDCIDFRPHRIPISGVVYSTNEAGASTILPSELVGLPSYGTQMFSTSTNYIVPAIVAPSNAKIEFYVNRTDLVAVDSYGSFFLIKGKEDIYSKAPKHKGKTAIAEVYIPGYPTYSADEAKAMRRPEYGVTVTPLGIENVTMKEINDMKGQIDMLTYYVTLSQLEAETSNMLIKDADGNTRFKNGIIVDPFNNLKIADTRNPEFKVALDFTEKSISPSVRTIPMDLSVSSASGVQLYKETIATLSPNSSSVKVISQPYATNYRTATTSYYNYIGQGFLTPEYDGAYDITSEPAVLSLDLTDAFDSLVDSINEIIPLTSTSSQVVSTSTNVSVTGNIQTTSVTQQIKDTTESLQVSTNTNEVPVGDFVTNITFNPYMRSREIKIYMGGLRPNTRHYFFFDGVDVNAHVAPASAKGVISDTESAYKAIMRTGKYGNTVKTDENGVLYAVFKLPPETFYVGDRKMDIVDVDAFDSISTAALSKGFLIYHAYNYSIESTELTMSTRMPEYDVDVTTTNRSVTTRTTQVVREGGGNRPDPLAQTFFLKREMAPSSGCIYASKIDLYFKRKSNTNGVTIMLREVINGYPAYEILPFSKVHLKKGSVNVSEDASIATTVTFKAPVRLDLEKEYCVVIMPDASDPDYLLFTLKVGGNDLITKNAITQDWGDGVLFTSTNNRAWTPYQDEDIKFTLYRYNFNEPTGTLTLATKGNEFFTLSDYANKFINNELVYALKSNTATGTFVAGSDIVNGTSIGATFQVGDYIAPVNGSGVVQDLLKVVAVAVDNNSLTIEEASTISGTYQIKAAVAGTVNYYSALNPKTLILENSSARSARKFTTSDSVVGFTSGATGDIGTIDNYNVSYIQPSIERITDKVASIGISAKVIDPENPTDLPYTKEMKFNDKTVFNEKGCLIYSKSNDTTESKNLKIQLEFDNSSVVAATPVVDIENAMLFVNKYNINNSKTSPSAVYISKIVSLAEGFDAEDFKLYVTAYRPVGTNIDAYIRIENASDPLTIEQNPWIPLDMVKGENMFSSTVNTRDFREFEYEITGDPGDDYGKTNGIVYYKNATGRYSKYKNFQIKLVLRSTDVGSVPRLLDYRGIAIE